MYDPSLMFEIEQTIETLHGELDGVFEACVEAYGEQNLSMEQIAQVQEGLHELIDGLEFLLRSLHSSDDQQEKRQLKEAIVNLTGGIQGSLRLLRWINTEPLEMFRAS